MAIMSDADMDAVKQGLARREEQADRLRRAEQARNEDRRTPVTLDAIIKRINRKLDHDGEKLCTARTESERTEVYMGQHYIIDTNSNSVVRGNIDPEELARELGVMSQEEKIARE